MAIQHVATPDHPEEGSSASRLRHYLDKCSLVYDQREDYSLVFRDRQIAREFHDFLAENYGGKKLGESQELFSAAVNAQEFHWVMAFPNDWKKSSAKKKEFEYVVNLWRVEHKDRSLTGPDEDQVRSKLERSLLIDQRKF